MKGVNTPPSLQNMYKELDKDIPEFSKPDHGYLMGWASQGTPYYLTISFVGSC